jgi:hypothetical protein
MLKKNGTKFYEVDFGFIDGADFAFAGGADFFE